MLKAVTKDALPHLPTKTTALEVEVKVPLVKLWPVGDLRATCWAPFLIMFFFSPDVAPGDTNCPLGSRLTELLHLEQNFLLHLLRPIARASLFFATSCIHNDDWNGSQNRLISVHYSILLCCVLLDLVWKTKNASGVKFSWKVRVKNGIAWTRC